MPEIQLGCSSHTVMSHGTKVALTHKHDWLILLLLAAIEAVMLLIEPFHRFVGEDMMTDLKYPFKPNTVPIWAVPIIAILLPIVIFVIYYIYRKDVYDLHHAVLGILFSAALTGVMTDSIKNAVGRPRPNFFYRCFPDGVPVFSNVTHDVVCHGEAKIIREGYKSFPSGHTSWSFCGLVFLSWYLSGKIKVFDRRGHIAKLCIVKFPILVAVLIGVSRVDDYWHHWTDVFAGALLGTTIATFCYLQFFPWPQEAKGWAPHAYFQVIEEEEELRSSISRTTPSSNGRPRPEQDSPNPFGIEITESRNNDTAALSAMEAGKRSV